MDVLRSLSSNSVFVICDTISIHCFFLVIDDIALLFSCLVFFCCLLLDAENCDCDVVEHLDFFGQFSVC